VIAAPAVCSGIRHRYPPGCHTLPMKLPPKRYNHIPDFCLIFSIVLAFGVAFFVPQANIFPWVVRITGWLIFAAGLALVFMAFATLKKQQTSTNPIDAPQKLVTTGPFAISRNPLYLGDVLVALGSALASGSWLALVVPLICFAVIDRLIIPIEERQMEQVFGTDYTRYTKTVRRWV